MISERLRRGIYDILRDRVLPNIRYEETDLMAVISSIWNVYEMPSTGTDRRYSNLGDEIEKHYTINPDWNEDKVFIGLLKVMDDEDKFLRFLEGILNIYVHKPEYTSIKDALSRMLEKENIHIIEDYDRDYHVTSVRLVVGDRYSGRRLEDRSRKFYVCSSKVIDYVNFSETDIKFPNDNDCFVLTFDYGWDDFGLKTRYHLYRYKNNEYSLIGEVKIMKRDTIDTSTVLPSSFCSLDEDYCSLGVGETYYTNIRKDLKENACIYLGELQDAALFSSIYKRFENDRIFINSLLRENSSEKMLRLGRFIINGRESNESPFSFEYNYSPKYNNDVHTTLDFEFKSEEKYFQRIYALIGENGVGKTTLMKELIEDIVISDKPDKDRKFEGLPPLFSCAMAITYSPFDTYPLNTDDRLKNKIVDYEYCGLFSGENVLKDFETRINDLADNINKIHYRLDNIKSYWSKMIKEVVPNIGIIKIDPDKDSNINKESLKKIYRQCSSGETIYLEAITSIFAKIRYNSILFLDEPEQHLHPTGINQLLSTISHILQSYDSYAIISTHSPFILREVPSSNVMIFHRHGDNLAVSPISIETFGEDVSVISDIVFDNRSQNKIFESYIETVVKEGNYDYDKALSALRSKEMEPSLNTKMTIMTLIEKQRK